METTDSKNLGTKGAMKVEKDQHTPGFRVEEKDDQIIVHAPYNREFIEMARAVRGSYAPETKTWAFSTSQKPIVQEICAYVFEGKRSKDGVKKSISKAMAALEKSLPPIAGKALMFSTMAVAFGMNGMKGLYTIQAISQMAKGAMPKTPRPFRPEGISTDYAPMNMGGQELFLERAHAGLGR